MTHTGQITVSKANTCYTGGVAYMEAGDTVAVRDLEPNRSAHFHIFSLFNFSKQRATKKSHTWWRCPCKAFALAKADCK